MTGAKAAQDVRGLTGNGIKVGIIDTGIDIDHPALGGGGTPGTTPFPSARVAYGYDFVGDAYDAGGDRPDLTPVPGRQPGRLRGPRHARGRHRRRQRRRYRRRRART